MATEFWNAFRISGLTAAHFDFFDSWWPFLMAIAAVLFCALIWKVKRMEMTLLLEDARNAWPQLWSRDSGKDTRAEALLRLMVRPALPLSTVAAVIGCWLVVVVSVKPGVLLWLFGVSSLYRLSPHGISVLTLMLGCIAWAEFVAVASLLIGATVYGIPVLVMRISEKRLEPRMEQERQQAQTEIEQTRADFGQRLREKDQELEETRMEFSKRLQEKGEEYDQRLRDLGSQVAELLRGK